MALRNLACMSGVLLSHFALAQAQEYPVKLVRMVVATSPGGGTDIAARLISPKLSEYFGRQVVIENRGGASTTIGGDYVARSAPDGYTLLMGVSSLAILPFVMAKVPYKPDDFAAITQVATSPNIIISHPSVPVKTTKELIAFAKTRPGQLNIAAGGAGSSQHLAIALWLASVSVAQQHQPGRQPHRRQQQNIQWKQYLALIFVSQHLLHAHTVLAEQITQLKIR